MGLLKKLLGGLFSVGVGYVSGYLTGKALHDFLAYVMVYKEFASKEWFNFEIYKNLYQHYAHGLDNLMANVFGITFGGLALAGYVSILYKLKKDY